MEDLQIFSKRHVKKIIFVVLLFVTASFFLSQAVFTQAESPTLLVTKTPQPLSKIVVTGEQVAVFTSFRLTAIGGDIDITNMTVDQVGIADDEVFSVVQVRNAVTGQHIGDALALGADGEHETQYRETIEEGQVVDYIIIANMSLSLSSYHNQFPQLALTGIDTTAELDWVEDIVGPSHRTNGNLSVGNVTLSSGPNDANTGETVQIEEDTIFNSFRGVVDSTEPVTPSVVIWHLSGSIDDEDLHDLRTEIVYNGETYTFPTFPYSVGSDPDRQWIGILAGAPVIDQGDSYEIRIAGSVDSSAIGETVDFIDFLKAGVYHTGMYYGYLTVAAALYDAPAITVTGGQSVFASVHPSNTYYRNEAEINSFNINVERGMEMEIVGFELNFASQVDDVKIWDKGTGEVVAGPYSTLGDGRLFIFPNGDWMAPVGTSTYVITASGRTSLESIMEATIKPYNSASSFKIQSN